MPPWLPLLAKLQQEQHSRKSSPESEEEDERPRRPTLKVRTREPPFGLHGDHEDDGEAFMAPRGRIRTMNDIPRPPHLAQPARDPVFVTSGGPSKVPMHAHHDELPHDVSPTLSIPEPIFEATPRAQPPFVPRAHSADGRLLHPKHHFEVSAPTSPMLHSADDRHPPFHEFGKVDEPALSTPLFDRPPDLSDLPPLEPLVKEHIPHFDDMFKRSHPSPFDYINDLLHGKRKEVRPR